MATLTHLDEQEAAKMVEIDYKDITARSATARGLLSVKQETIRLIQQNQVPKGDVFAVARVAGIMAAKETYQQIINQTKMMQQMSQEQHTYRQEEKKKEAEERMQMKR